jgi:hypothetical protein
LEECGHTVSYRSGTTIPALDKFSNSGIRFRNAERQNPWALITDARECCP